MRPHYAPALRAAAIRSGHNLEIMTARIFKVSAAPSVIGIDLVRPMVMRVRPEGKPAPPDAAEYFVKLRIAYHKGVMLRRDFLVSVQQIKSDLIVHLDRKEWAEGRWSREPEDFNEKSCGFAHVARVDDGMVKFNAHSRDSSYKKFAFVIRFLRCNIRKGRARRLKWSVSEFLCCLSKILKMRSGA